MRGHRRPISWWFAYATALLLSAWFFGWNPGAALALAVSGVQLVLFTARHDSFGHPDVKLAAAVFGLLALGAAWPVLVAAVCLFSWSTVLFGDLRVRRPRWRPA